MKLHLLLPLVVGLAYASTSPAWKNNIEYVYLVNGRTLTSLHELSDHYAGVFLKAKFHIALRHDGRLQARVEDAQYAQIHTRLPDSWNTDVPESQLKYEKLGISNKPFQIVAEDGLFTNLIVEKEVTNWEANILKSIVSQFQLDVQGRRAIHSPSNILPKKDKLEGVFKTMEETVTGETETSYEIHPLPDYIIQSENWLVPKPELIQKGQTVEVIKNKNYTNSEERPAYHYGFGEVKGEPTSNQMGGFFLRQSNSRVILTGKLSKFTIQQAQTINKIIINPTINSKEQGSVVSTLNVTLHEVRSLTDADLINPPFCHLIHPVEIGNLIYTYSDPFAVSNGVRQKHHEPGFMEDSNEVPAEGVMQYQPRPVISQAPESPLLPYYMGYKGQSVKTYSAFDLKKNVQIITKEIAEDLPEPEQILVRSTLSKYIQLCSMVRLLNDEEISSVAQQLYSQCDEGPERVIWEVFRDAVAEAGTGPAFLNVKKWIETKKIEKEEASEVVASMAHAVRAPTEEYMLKFFELVKNPKVINQEHLNETALLSFTRLVNRVYVNRNESHNQYPVHSFKSFYTTADKEFITSTVLPYLSEHLHEAVSKADSRKIHVYIRALGNVGHKKILEAFEPYLEGTKQASQFQRMLMVLSMDKLVYSDPVVARSVLYRIYQNTGEVPEVRVVAVYQLMRTVPPVEMIQSMAENTNTDIQEQVNAAVKSAIESASQLTSPGSQILRKSAEIAKPLLTKKEYGLYQSLNFLQDFAVENMNIELKHNILQIGSSDHTLPKGIKYTMRGNLNGMKHYFINTQVMISSIKELANVLYQQTEEYKEKSHGHEQHPWSSDKIAQTLNLQTNQREQLEGFIYSEMESLQRIWSFDNETIEQLPQVIRQTEQLFKNGKTFSYIKLRHLKEMALSFPTEMGIPFLYTYDMPLLVQFGGKIKAKASPEVSKNNNLRMPRNIYGEIDATVTVGTKTQSHLCVVTPFDHQIYISGFNQNAQAHLPLIGKVDIDLQDQMIHAKLELQVKETHKDARLLHYSSWPYTSRSDIMDLKPVPMRLNTHRIKPEDSSHRTFDFTVGEKETGISLRVWGHHPRQSLNLLKVANLLRTEGIATMWQQVWDDFSMQHSEASIGVIPSQSTTRKVILNLRYQKQYLNNLRNNKNNKGFWNYIWGSKQQKEPHNQSEEEFWANDQLPLQLESDIEKRKESIMAYVGAGIPSSRLHFLDATAEFKGGKDYEHILTLAAAKSNVAPQSRFVSFYKNNAKKPLLMALQIKGYRPNTNELNLKQSLSEAPKSKYEVQLQYGEDEAQSSKIRGTVNLDRSTARRQYLQEKPLYQICKEQMKEEERILSACQNMTIESNFLDDIKVELQYENFKPEVTSFIDDIYKGVRVWYYPNTNISTIESVDQNKVNLNIQFHPQHLRQVNVTVRTSNEEYIIYNITVCNGAKFSCVPNPAMDLEARLLGGIMVKEDIKPTCVVDSKYAQTFSNKTYPVSLGSVWTVMMLYVPQEALLRGDTHQEPIRQLQKQQENFAVLVRELAPYQREVKITLKNPDIDGETVELSIKPKKGSTPSAYVLVDNKEVEFDDKQAADLFNGYVEIYALPGGEVKVEIQDWFHIIFDGNRVKLTATSNKLRDAVVGLCGRFSGDQYEDFWTPNNCIVRSSNKFIQSFILTAKPASLQREIRGAKGGPEYQPQQEIPAVKGKPPYQPRQEISPIKVWLQQELTVNYQFDKELEEQCIPKTLPLYANVISDHDVERLEGSEQEISSDIRLKTVSIKDNGQVCFTIHPVSVCKTFVRESITKEVPVYCVTDSNVANYWENQINKGENPDFSQKPVTKTVPLVIPQQCG